MNILRHVFNESLLKRTRNEQRGFGNGLYEIVYSNKKETLPDFPLQMWDNTVQSACTGPNAGLTSLTLDSEKLVDEANTNTEGMCEKWNTPNESCYGASVSLYEPKWKPNKQSDEESLSIITETQKVTVETIPDDHQQSTGKDERAFQHDRQIGDPIADVYGSIVRGNNVALAIADGSGWGKKPRLAARCAVGAALEHIIHCTEIFNSNPSSTTVFRILTSAIRASQKLIISKEATLTTLSIVVVCNTMNGNQAVFTASVGDCSIFIYSPKNGTIMETTVGSHPDNGSRSHRSSGGSLGPSVGAKPDLSNLSFSCISVDAGDLVMLMTDGVSDNFLAKTRDHYHQNERGISVVPKRSNRIDVPHYSLYDINYLEIHDCCAASHSLLKCLETHYENLKDRMTAQTCTTFLLNTVAEISEEKRQFRKDCIEKGIDERVKEKEDPEFAEEKKSKIGKLDHATVLCYQAK